MRTVKGAWGMGLTPLRMSEAPILKILPAGAPEKCKWWNTIDGSGGVKGGGITTRQLSSYHAAPGQDPVRYWFAGEANVCVTERCGQAVVSSAYNVPKVGVDAHGSPARILVRKTSWYDAVQAAGTMRYKQCARPAGTMRYKQRLTGSGLSNTVTATREAGFRQEDHT
jgi:hypothetical protein